MLKRTMDALLAGTGLLLLAPLMLLIAAAVKLDSAGPVFFRQERVGKGFKPFWIIKFRTMTRDASSGPGITAGRDPRITRVGRFLRMAKLDEFPQLLNVLAGDMSFVGPRPELPRYVAMYRADYAELLSVRPGLTDPASLKYRDESGLLGEAADPELEYVGRVLPDKIRLAKEYIRRASLAEDCRILAATAKAVLWPQRHDA